MAVRHEIFRIAVNLFVLASAVRAQNTTVAHLTTIANITIDANATAPTTAPSIFNDVANSSADSITVNSNLSYSTVSYGSDSNSSDTNSTQLPMSPALCRQCIDCTETNETCLSPAGICFISFSTLTNMTDRGCDMNKTSCEIPYPGGISANGVCQYCCSGELCNDVATTLSQCLEIIGSGASGIGISARAIVLTLVLSAASLHFGRL